MSTTCSSVHVKSSVIVGSGFLIVGSECENCGFRFLIEGSGFEHISSLSLTMLHISPSAIVAMLHLMNTFIYSFFHALDK